MVTVDGAFKGVFSRATGTRRRFHLMIRLFAGVKGGGELTIFRRNEVQLRGGGQFLKRNFSYVRLVTVRTVIRTCDGGFRKIVSLWFRSGN